MDQNQLPEPKSIKVKLNIFIIIKKKLNINNINKYLEFQI